MNKAEEKIPRFKLFCPKCGCKRVKVSVLHSAPTIPQPENMDWWAEMSVIREPLMIPAYNELIARCPKCHYAVRKNWPT
jgi:hypothetical protein